MGQDSRNGAPLRTWLTGIVRTARGKPQTRRQLIDILRYAETQNLLDPDTLLMMEGALHVSEMHVRDIMIPRAQMVAVSEDAEPKEFAPRIIDSGHSRFPVIDEKRDQVVGILLAKDLLAYYCHSEGGRFNIKDVMRSPVFVPESKRLNILLREFRASRNHLAIVVDEYGGTAGLVSIEDVLEQIVGEIEDEHDIDEQDYIKQHSEERYTVQASTPIETFNEYFGTGFSTEEFDTVGGLLLKEFGHLPRRGESLEFSGFNFKILRADRRRIHLIRLVWLSKQTPAQSRTA